MTNPQSAKDRIKGAQRARRAFRLNLRGDLRAQIELLDAELTDLRQAEKDRPQKRLADAAPTEALAHRIQGLREEMAESWLDLELEAQPWRDWESFKAKNPVRKDNQIDENAGFNFDKLVFEFTPKCVVEPKLDEEDWEGIFDKCSPADLRNLGSTTFALHQLGTDIPKSRAASVTMRLSDESSELPEPGESVSEGSTDGSLSSYTNTTTPMESSPEQP